MLEVRKKTHTYMCFIQRWLARFVRYYADENRIIVPKIKNNNAIKKIVLLKIY